MSIVTPMTLTSATLSVPSDLVIWDISELVDGKTNVWLANTNDAKIANTPEIPKMPKPGTTKISIRIRPTPNRNSTIYNTSAVPPRKRLQKNSMKHNADAMPKNDVIVCSSR